MNFPVIKKSAYALVHTPNMMLHNGVFPTQEIKREGAEYLKNVQEFVRSYEECVGYAPNQAYIGNITPEELANMPKPWHANNVENASATGKFGEIVPEDMFYAFMQVCDVFDLVKLEASFAENMKAKFQASEMFAKFADQIKAGVTAEEIDKLVADKGEPFYLGETIVGCLRAAHDSDANLSAEHMFERIACKASGVIGLLALVKDYDASSIPLLIECSEESVGDQFQPGGGNMSKSLAEIAGLTGATGFDVRAFCAGPSHAILAAAALVQAGVYDTVAVAAGGCTAKLGMNAGSHRSKNLPFLEDTLGAFAFLITKNDGVNPIIRTDIVGRLQVGSGTTPQAVMSSLVLNPLKENNLTIPDVDIYSPEMQNPEITVPAGAGDVPVQNLKMIAALGVMNKQLERKDIMNFVNGHGYVGFAPTQGHIPSGVPSIGHACDAMVAGDINRMMLIGKGSLFLGKITNLFDGTSFIIEKNPGVQEEEKTVDTEEIKKMIAEAMLKTADLLSQE